MSGERDSTEEGARRLIELVCAEDGRIEYSEESYPGSWWVDFRRGGRVVAVEVTSSGEFGISVVNGELPGFGGHERVLATPDAAAHVVVDALSGKPDLVRP